MRWSNGPMERAYLDRLEQATKDHTDEAVVKVFRYTEGPVDGEVALWQVAVRHDDLAELIRLARLGLTLDGDAAERQGWLMDALEEVHRQFQAYGNASTPYRQAEALVALHNAVSDLSSYHPSYDLETGTLGWERADAEESSE